MNDLEQLADEVARAETLREQAFENLNEAQMILLEAQVQYSHADQTLLEAKQKLIQHARSRSIDLQHQNGEPNDYPIG